MVQAGSPGPRPAGSPEALLLINLGSPDSPSVPDVRRYLNEFLMDPRVIDVPWPLRRLIVSAFVLPRRPAATSEAYACIWTAQGSPLKQHTRALAQRLARELGLPVRWAMRYGEPSIERVLSDLDRDGVGRVWILPLYPHVATSTTQTSLEQAERVVARQRLTLTLEPLPAFYADRRYIAAVAATAADHLAPEDHLLFSYHGLPLRHVRRADPTAGHCLSRPDCCAVPSPAHALCYRHQVGETSRLVAQELGLPAARWEVAFQSRLGRSDWLTPATDEVLKALPARGVTQLAVICPAFLADNLETLEEIGIRGRAAFLAAGGQRFTLIPCLNDRADWVTALAAIITEPSTG